MEITELTLTLTRVMKGRLNDHAILRFLVPLCVHCPFKSVRIKCA